jgi:hypothetical protein
MGESHQTALRLAFIRDTKSRSYAGFAKKSARGAHGLLNGLWDKGAAVIRQTITCDICGTEKKQTNHWFVAYEHGGELKIGKWSSSNRLRPGSKHLCGQTCLHMLIDEYVARELALRPQPTKEQAEADEPASQSAPVEIEPARIDFGSAAAAMLLDDESSARLIPTPEPEPFKPSSYRPPVEIKPTPAKPVREEAPLAGDLDEPPMYASRDWRAEAWKRERDRQACAGGAQHYNPARKRSAS